MTTGADPRLRDYLGHILGAIQKIGRYTAGMGKASFEHAEQTQDAVIRNFEVIGEACRNIERRYPEFVRAHPEVPWALAYVRDAKRSRAWLFSRRPADRTVRGASDAR